MFKNTLSTLKNTKRLPYAVVLSLLLISANLAHAQGSLPDCHVLSIGVDNYTHISKLKGDVNDARNTSAAFTAQQGKLFGKVSAYTLADNDATRANIVQHALAIEKAAKAGDYVVYFMSGHGGVAKESNQWYFCPCDFHPQNPNSKITDQQILEAADTMAKQSKKVVIIVDACYSGQLRVAAKPYLEKYRNPNGGGIVVMVSSAADQTSNALGAYSAFAKAFADSMSGHADLNQDGKVTLDEIRQYSSKRTMELLQSHGNSSKQDTAVAWSMSFSAHTPMALPAATNQAVATNMTPAIKMKPRPEVPAKTTSPRWMGSENLAGYGALAFTFYNDGSVLMADAKASSKGTWETNGNQVTLRFENGRVLYTATLQDGRMWGSATNGNTTWTWSVQREPAFAASTVADAH